VTHLGRRLSALIDGELDGSERERVLLHLGGCDSCRDEVAALRMVKRRMSALGEVAAGAGAGLTGRLIGLSALASLQGQQDADRPSAGSLPDRPVGGFGDYADLLAGYEAAGGRPIDLSRVRFWHTLGSLRWGVMCLGMYLSWSSGLTNSVERPMIGRRVSETEADLVVLLEQGL